jgi:LmbE family N-acetylglucosaminyl deacetylase
MPTIEEAPAMAEAVLVVAPHPDDEAIGCGGTICLHRQRGDPVHVVFLTSGERGLTGMVEDTVRLIREAEAREAGNVLGVNAIDFLRLPDMGVGESLNEGARLLQEIMDKRQPDLIYLPHPEESHPDHEAALPLVRAARTALFGENEMPELRAYEVWSPMTRYGWVEDISAVIRQKLRAVRCYRSQLQSFRYDRAVLGLNRYRGILGAGSRYAEAFTYLEPISSHSSFQ